MEMKIAQDAALWDKFVCENGPVSGAFLQSWQWGEFSARAGAKINRFEFHKDGAMVGLALFAEKHLPLGKKYIFSPRGPIIKSSEISLEDFLIDLKSAMKNFKSVFLRLEPPIETLGRMDKKLLIQTVDIHPCHTLVIDLDIDEKVLLDSMHQKTRYNINIAEKKGVKVGILNKSEFDEAWKLFQGTSESKGFRLHRKQYYEELLKTDMIHLSGASIDGHLIAVAIMCDFDNVRTYLHGASNVAHRALMSPYLLHWHEMLDAKKAGIKFYDFWGISDTKDEWAGITRFKRGFGGFELSYAGTFDLAINKPLYLLYRVARRVRRII